MKISTIVAVSLCAVLAATSATAKVKKDFEHFTEIVVGQNKVQVAHIMGQPENTELNGEREAWQYCARDGGSNRFVAVFFNAGSVVKTVTYSRLWIGGCTGQFHPVDWSDESILLAKPRGK